MKTVGLKRLAGSNPVYGAKWAGNPVIGSGLDCKSSVFGFCWFKSSSAHLNICLYKPNLVRQEIANL